MLHLSQCRRGLSTILMAAFASVALALVMHVPASYAAGGWCTQTYNVAPYSNTYCGGGQAYPTLQAMSVYPSDHTSYSLDNVCTALSAWTAYGWSLQTGYACGPMWVRQAYAGDPTWFGTFRNSSGHVRDIIAYYWW